MFYTCTKIVCKWSSGSGEELSENANVRKIYKDDQKQLIRKPYLRLTLRLTKIIIENTTKRKKIKYVYMYV